MKEIFHRSSVRKFTDQPVEPEKVEQLLRAAMSAPTAGNQRAWEFYVVENEDILKRLGSKDVSPYSSPAKNAPMAIVIAYNEDTAMPEYNDIDGAIAAENIWLEADHLGLGAVMLGIAPHKERVEKVNEILGLPKGKQAFTIIPVGYPESEREQPDRFDKSKVHYIR
ncbi:MAG: nitroreductase family protein [Tractidigestivibacter sp.]|jgi:nitroreductase|uniref:nitroreductase family protein n=1 Tax=Tractidigestivibacter sp. TaxID=2847320 RepID=UPI003D928402